MIRVTDDAGNLLTSYTYGVGNQRLATAYGTSSTRTVYVWGAGGVTAEYADTGALAWSKSYIYLGGRLLATHTQVTNTERVEFHHPDRLGTRLITVAGGTDAREVVEQETLPFGTEIGFSGSSSTRRFTSYDRNRASGLDYAVNRQYDSLQGRFTQVDPIGAGATDISDPQSWNMYAYCGNDPVNYTDPEGLFFKKLFKAIWKVLTSKWFIIAATIALAVLTIGASLFPSTLGWSAANTLFIQEGLSITSTVLGTHVTAAGWVAASLTTALAIPSIDFSLKGILRSAVSYGLGSVSGGLGAVARGHGDMPDWHSQDSSFLPQAGSRIRARRLGRALGRLTRRIRASLRTRRQTRGILRGGRRVRGDFPHAGAPNETLYRVDSHTGNVTNYQTYDHEGLPVKRVDITGAAHDGIPTPHVHVFGRNTNPRTGQVFVNAGQVRPATPGELP